MCPGQYFSHQRLFAMKLTVAQNLLNSRNCLLIFPDFSAREKSAVFSLIPIRESCLAALNTLGESPRGELGKYLILE